MGRGKRADLIEHESTLRGGKEMICELHFCDSKVHSFDLSYQNVGLSD